MPFFSIITVVLNDREGLARTAASIERQSLNDFEWRIVDGGSTDGTVELARELAGRIDDVHFTSGPDAGLYDAMNKGLRKAQGDFVMFMNAGDEYARQDSLDGLRLALGSDAWDIVFGSSIMRYGERDILRRVKPPGYIWHGQPGMHQATAYRRGFHQRYEYSLHVRVTADYECLARMAAAGARMKSIDHLVSINEIKPDSASIRMRGLTPRECFRTQRDILKSPIGRRLLSYARRQVNGISSMLIARLMHARADI